MGVDTTVAVAAEVAVDSAAAEACHNVLALQLCKEAHLVMSKTGTCAVFQQEPQERVSSNPAAQSAAGCRCSPCLNLDVGASAGNVACLCPAATSSELHQAVC